MDIGNDGVSDISFEKTSKLAVLKRIPATAWILARPKGRKMHKLFGWVWVFAMGATAVSSFWLTGLNGGSYSWIHGLSAWTMIGLPMGIYAIRKKQVQKHAKSMKGMFLGGMLIAGLFTFLPGRLMWDLFFTI